MRKHDAPFRATPYHPQPKVTRQPSNRRYTNINAYYKICKIIYSLRFNILRWILHDALLYDLRFISLRTQLIYILGRYS